MQDVNFDFRPQCCQSLEVFAQLFFAAPGHVSNEEFSPLFAFSVSCFIWRYFSIILRVIVRQLFTAWPGPTHFAFMPFGQ